MKNLSKLALASMALCTQLTFAENAKSTDHQCAAAASCKGSAKAEKEHSCKAKASCKGDVKEKQKEHSCKAKSSCKGAVMDSTTMSSSSAGCNSKSGCGASSVK